ncbi:MAG TPA: phosphoadenylyl-sulfate reductase [Micromonosporaceae bacterium]|nr:phosphoadenylyl-sulfate reductase [Micromonosporaceae bacterium]
MTSLRSAINLIAPTSELAEIAYAAQPKLDGAPAEAVIEWAVEQFGPRFCITSSMADGVLAHLASRVAPGIDVVFLDTGLHFPQTLRVRDEVAQRMPVRVLSIQPRQTVGQQDGEYGPRLFERDPDTCCALRKVEPLERALADYDAWAAGIRRGETPARANVREVDFEVSRGKVKVAPLARWTDADVAAYIERHDIPVNPLLSQGYGSIGCWPCTRKVRPGEDPRAGRWALFDKTECGLHARA